MKKFISFALAASMALSMIPATAFASSDLTTSHSNIRVTANTEFKPKEDAGSEYRDVPYIILEASNDFVDTKQTFELALENAEWLEMDGDDGDKLYVEDADVMKKYVEFIPEGGASKDDSSSTPGTITEDIGTLERAYQTKAQALYDAAVDYAKALDAANSNADNSAAVSSLGAAKTELAAAEKELAAAEKVNDSVKDFDEANLTKLLNDYNEAVSASEAAGSVSEPTAGNPDSTTAADFSKGRYKGTEDSSSFTVTLDYYIYAEDDTADTPAYSKGDAVVIEGDSALPTVDEVKTAIAELGNKVELNDAYVTAKAEWDRFENSGDVTDKVTEAKEAAEAAGLIFDDTANKFETVASAMARKQKAADAVAAAQKKVDAAQAKIDAAQAIIGATGDVSAKKTAFETALKERNEAGAKVVSKAGAQGIQDLEKIDKAVKLCDNTGSYDIKPSTVPTTTFKDLGIEAVGFTTAVADAYDEVEGSNGALDITIDKKSDSRIIVTTDGYKFKDGDVIRIPLFVRTTGGVASVSIDSLNSEFTSEGKTFAKTADGDTNLTIEKTQSFYDGDEVKNIYIEELVPGTLEDDGLVSLRVNGDFKLKRGNNFSIKRITGNNLDQDLTESVYTDPKCEDKFTKGDDSDEIYIQLGGTQSTQAVQYRITGLLIVEDGADFGDEATITVSGGGTSKQTVTIGTYEDYGVKMTAEDKELPVIYAGTKASSKYDNQTLKVVIEETVANSFIDNRKMELTLPDGVEFVMDNGDAEQKISSIDDITEDFKAYNFQGTLNQVKDAFTVDADGGKITITSKDLPEGIFESSGSNKDRKRKFEFSVHVSAEADFTGDVVMTLSGPAVANQSVSATIATVKAPIEVRTTVNELKIDYRNTDVADITLVEPEAGLWAKDDVIRLEGERMSFEGGAKAEVVNGDMKLAKLGGDYVDTEDSGDDKNGVLFVKVDSRSSKTPAEIKISGLSLYMNRSLAAGDYKLKVFGDEDNEFFMNNYHSDGDDYANSFETAKVTVMNDFVKVVTAGRDKDDATFTTSIVVPVGSDVITAGTREIKLSEMEGGACPPAYINNDGYTMLPVRAVTESLNNIAAVRWDDATKTCTIGFGQRVFSMTVGSKVLNMNGVSTALNAAPEIRDGRVFLPLRDLGYALGLSESQISWDATTQTARLN